MNYLLTQAEIDALAPKEEVTRRDHALAAARAKILLLAGFDCIHDKAGRNRGGYCDDCPCSPTHGGPSGENDYKTWASVCWLEKRYSQ